MRKVRSVFYGIIAYALSFLPAFSVLDRIATGSRDWAYRALARVVEKEDFPATSKLRFELTLAKWRESIGVGEGLSTGGLRKSSHHFMQIGSQEKPLREGLTCA